MPRWVVGDRGYTGHAFRERIWDRGAWPAIPPQRHEAPVACPDWIYSNRNQVERLWARLKEGCAIAARYEKPPSASWASSPSQPPSIGSSDDRPQQRSRCHGFTHWSGSIPHGTNAAPGCSNEGYDAA